MPILLLVNLGFGSTILLAISLLGEYKSRIVEEVKKDLVLFEKLSLRTAKFVNCKYQ